MSGVELIAGEPKPRETNKAKLACNDYLRMGAGRSLPKLHKIYTERAEDSPPTKTLRTLLDWSSTYGWQTRAAEYDQRIEERKTAEAEEIMATGWAAPYNRVVALSELIDEIKDDLKNGLYQDDIKLSANGKEVKVKVFKAQHIAALQRSLDDIAKETGGRKQKMDVTSNDEPIKGYVVFSPDDWDDDGGDTNSDL